MEEHVPFARLLILAAADHLMFTLEELAHLKICHECFAQWAEFISTLQYLYDSRLNTRTSPWRSL